MTAFLLVWSHHRSGALANATIWTTDGWSSFIATAKPG
jgi:hypothetical protein